MNSKMDKSLIGCSLIDSSNDESIIGWITQSIEKIIYAKKWSRFGKLRRWFSHSIKNINAKNGGRFVEFADGVMN